MRTSSDLGLFLFLKIFHSLRNGYIPMTGPGCLQVLILLALLVQKELILAQRYWCACRPQDSEALCRPDDTQFYLLYCYKSTNTDTAYKYCRPQGSKPSAARTIPPPPPTRAFSPIPCMRTRMPRIRVYACKASAAAGHTYAESLC